MAPEFAPGNRGAKSSGILRILAIGGSTTYGVNNLDGTTWPALLERELGRKVPVEVLNGGVPEARLEKLLQELSKKWFRYEPDIVIYYGAYNEGPHPFHTVDASIGRFHRDSWMGRATVLLHYRSLLYTYLVEKLHMYRLTRQIKVVSKLRHFQEQLNEFVNLVRSQGATPVWVLQVMQFEPREEIRDLDLGSEQEIQALRLKVAKEAESDWVYRFRRMRVHEAQLFVEVVRRVGEASGVQVIDPPEAFAAYGGSKDLFCDEVHLTDAANELLAQQISSQVELGTLRRR